jgi:hypothetical protein
MDDRVRSWAKLERADAGPRWANLRYPIDYQAIVYYSARKRGRARPELGLM